MLHQALPQTFTPGCHTRGKCRSIIIKKRHPLGASLTLYLVKLENIKNQF